MHPASFVVFLLCFVFCSCVWNGPEEESVFLPLDDSEYPYAGVPRLVIETEGFREIRDRETEIPARLQIYGEDAPESEVMALTIRGRGNSSFMMTKYSMKLVFDTKHSLFHMPSNKDWVLISNFRDKTHLRNYITFKLAESLGDYAPRSKFVEVYLNRRYVGIYLLTESIKVGKNRINITQTDSSFFIEKTTKPNADDFYFKSSLQYIFKIRYPKKPSSSLIQRIQEKVDSFENCIQNPSADLDNLIDLQSFTRYYMVQEFSKNIDGAFGRSVYITKEAGKKYQMGPLWDFDLAYGLANESKSSPYDWYVRYQGWNKYLIQNKQFQKSIHQYWNSNKKFFLALLDTIDSTHPKIHKAVLNDEKRWPILENSETWPLVDKYTYYEDSLDSLKLWIFKRKEWFDAHL